ncbi:hypothetical protein DLAC_11043 [Tieghemostelium lacteum]|uniref:Uncharacterized protein n=1 Tax=Tieghemostelium lacteum TaxID=361077 RepID=A0A151Z3E5_TIELA|nr:hypothetical protein DLAC_11043 [Tieghemostelium lacteum]|eukprot:KYQ88344.1 hypothetical protein DLAC_11043 [Tieghemostelium lacteum]
MGKGNSNLRQNIIKVKHEQRKKISKTNTNPQPKQIIIFQVPNKSTTTPIPTPKKLPNPNHFEITNNYNNNNNNNNNNKTSNDVNKNNNPCRSLVVQSNSLIGADRRVIKRPKIKIQPDNGLGLACGHQKCRVPTVKGKRRNYSSIRDINRHEYDCMHDCDRNVCNKFHRGFLCPHFECKELLFSSSGKATKHHSTEHADCKCKEIISLRKVKYDKNSDGKRIINFFKWKGKDKYPKNMGEEMLKVDREDDEDDDDNEENDDENEDGSEMDEENDENTSESSYDEDEDMDVSEDLFPTDFQEDVKVNMSLKILLDIKMAFRISDQQLEEYILKPMKLPKRYSIQNINNFMS